MSMMLLYNASVVSRDTCIRINIKAIRFAFPVSFQHVANIFLVLIIQNGFVVIS